MAPVGPRVGDPERMVRNQSANPFRLYNNFNYIRVCRFVLMARHLPLSTSRKKDESTKTIRREVTLLTLS